jgi:hypothetical protein
MRKLVMVLALSSVSISPAFGAPASRAAGPTQWTHENPSFCLGNSRSGGEYGASAFGGRSYGQFGQEHSDYVADVNSGELPYENYGDALSAYRDRCGETGGGGSPDDR